MKPVCFLTVAVTFLGVTAGSPRSRDDAPPPGAPFRFRDVTTPAQSASAHVVSVRIGTSPQSGPPGA